MPTQRVHAVADVLQHEPSRVRGRARMTIEPEVTGAEQRAEEPCSGRRTEAEGVVKVRIQHTQFGEIIDTAGVVRHALTMRGEILPACLRSRYGLCAKAGGAFNPY